LRFQDICNGYNPVEYETEENGEVVKKVRLEPLAENPKLDMLEEAIDQIGDKQVVVWCSRTQLLYDAMKRLADLGYTCGSYDGVNHNREEDYAKFAEGKIQILFCNQASAGYGLDDLKEADYAIYLCNSYSVEQRVQSENRIYRGEITRSKYFIDITCKGTVEERVTKALLIGQELIDSGVTDVSVYTLED
jgi:SNF2 family DNA or RNA helicase